MHTSAGAACGRDDDRGDAPELYVCGSFPLSKLKELGEPVNERIREAELAHSRNRWIGYQDLTGV